MLLIFYNIMSMILAILENISKEYPHVVQFSLTTGETNYYLSKALIVTCGDFQREKSLKMRVL